MIAYIRKMAVEEQHWLDDGSFRDGVALCQVIPGATAMQTAAYVGLRSHGLLGATASFVGFGLPAFMVMMVLSSLYMRGHALPIVVSALAGLGAIVVAIVANAAVVFGTNTLVNLRAPVIALVAAALFGLGASPLAVILLAALMGLGLFKARSSSAGPRPDVRTLYSLRSLAVLLVLSVASLVLLSFIDVHLFRLAVLMLRVDLMAFGGGFASVPIMFHEIVDVRHLLDSPTLLTGIALGQATPGPIVITATFIGFLLFGPLGGIVATISVFLPSFLVVVGVAPYYEKLRGSSHFHKIIEGILCSFVGLLLSVTVKFAMNVSWDLKRVLLAVLGFAALRLKVNILWVVLIGTIISVLVF
jgi:chromate transporter